MAILTGPLNRVSVPAWPGFALVHRDLVQGLRRVRPFAFLVALVVVQAYAVLTLFPEGQNALAEAAHVGDVLFVSFVLVMLGVAATVLPAAAATTVTSERELGTYDLVQLTLLRRGTFFFAKAVNAWGYFLIFVVASFPMAAITFFLVGLEVGQVFAALSVLLAVSVALTMIGVAASCRARRTTRAIFLAYSLSFLFMGGHLLLLWMLVATGWPARFVELTPALLTSMKAWVFVLVPPMTIWAVRDNTFGASVVWMALGYHALLSVVFAWWGWRGLLWAETGVEGRAQRRGRLRFRPIPDWANPMSVKELSWSGGIQRRGMWGVTVLMCLLFLALTAWLIRVTGDRSAGTFVCIIAFCMLYVLTPMFVVHPLTREKDFNNLDMLRMTMLTPKQIVLGKIWANGRYLFYMALGILVVFLGLATVMRANVNVRQFVFGTITGSACLVFYTGLCAWIGARSTCSGTALVVSFACGFAVGVGVPILLMVLYRNSFGVEDGSLYILCIAAPFFGWLGAEDVPQQVVAWITGLVVYVALGWVFVYAAVVSYLPRAYGRNASRSNGVGDMDATVEHAP